MASARITTTPIRPPGGDRTACSNASSVARDSPRAAPPAPPAPAARARGSRRSRPSRARRPAASSAAAAQAAARRRELGGPQRVELAQAAGELGGQRPQLVARRGRAVAVAPGAQRRQPLVLARRAPGGRPRKGSDGLFLLPNHASVSPAGYNAQAAMPAAARLAPLGLCAACSPSALGRRAPTRRCRRRRRSTPSAAFSDGLFLRTPRRPDRPVSGRAAAGRRRVLPAPDAPRAASPCAARASSCGVARAAVLLRRLGRLRAAPPAGADVAPSALPRRATTTWRSPPLGDRFIVQAGQFDAPFSLENRTSDAYTDFIERAMTRPHARRAAQQGARRDGPRPRRRRALLLLGRPLQRRRARASATSTTRPTPSGASSLTPFARSGARLAASSRIGGSAWYGNHVLGPEAPDQATPGGMVFFEPHWTMGQTMPLAFELHEQGTRDRARRRAEPADRRPLRPARRGRLEAAAPRRERHLAPAPARPSGDAVLDGIGGYGEALVLAAGRRSAAARARARAAAAPRQPTARRRPSTGLTEGWSSPCAARSSRRT